jgi:hypothetical protein
MVADGDGGVDGGEGLDGVVHHEVRGAAGADQRGGEVAVLLLVFMWVGEWGRRGWKGRGGDGGERGRKTMRMTAATACAERRRRRGRRRDTGAAGPGPNSQVDAIGGGEIWFLGKKRPREEP